MAWQRKTLSEHIAQFTAWFEAEIINGSAILRGSLLAVFAKSCAAAISMFEGFLEAQARNQHTSTMDEEHLRQDAADWGIVPKPATYSIGNILITGAIGSIIEEGELLQRSDGVQFALDNDVLINQIPQIAQISAIEPGANSNTIPHLNLSFVSPQNGVQSNVIVDEIGIVGGNDDESLESLRGRISARKSQPPRGGSKPDYIKWAKEITGITRAWVVGDWAGKGSVGVLFVFDNRPNLIPTSDDVAKLQLHLINNAPVGQETRTFAIAPTPKPLNMQISISPDNPTNRANVISALGDFIKSEAIPGGTILHSKLGSTITNTDGIIDNHLIVPSISQAHQKHEIAVLGVVEFVAHVA